MTQNVRNGAGVNDLMLAVMAKGRSAEPGGRNFESFLNTGSAASARKTDPSASGSKAVEPRSTERRVADSSSQPNQARADRTENRPELTTQQKESVNNTQEAGTEELSEEVSDVMNQTEEPEEEAMAALAASVLEFLNGIAGEVLSVNPEAIEDWMNANGVSLSDMLNPDTLKQMVLDLNGLSDPAGFLTNGEALGEWNEIQARLAEFLQENGTAAETLKSMETALETEQTDLLSEPEGDLIGAGQSEMLQEAGSTDFEQEAQTEGEESQAGQRAAHGAGSSAEERRSAGATEAGNEHLGTVFLNQMHEAIGNAIEALDAEVNVRQTEILEQVVNQIRVGMSQEVTSMDFMLHPESLGRVYVSVLAKEGVMTAQFTVQTQEAKQALESQMPTLRQAFEDQGLKVESVEVNVSEFAFGEQSQGSGQAEDGKNGSNRRNRRFDYSAGIGSEDRVNPADGEDPTARNETLSPLEAQNLEMAGAQVDYSA